MKYMIISKQKSNAFTLQNRHSSHQNCGHPTCVSAHLYRPLSTSGTSLTFYSQMPTYCTWFFEILLFIPHLFYETNDLHQHMDNH